MQCFIQNPCSCFGETKLIPRTRLFRVISHCYDISFALRWNRSPWSQLRILRPLSPIPYWIGFKNMKPISDFIHDLWTINGHSSPMSIKHTMKPKEIEYKREKCIYKKQ